MIFTKEDIFIVDNKIYDRINKYCLKGGRNGIKGKRFDEN